MSTRATSWSWLLSSVLLASAPSVVAAGQPADDAAPPGAEAEAPADDATPPEAADPAVDDGAAAAVDEPLAEDELAPAAATASPHRRGLAVEVGVWMGAFFAAKDHEFYDITVAEQQPMAKTAPDFGVRLGLYPMRYLGLEGELGAVPTETRATEDELTLLAMRGQLVAQLPGKVTPFLLAGVTNFVSRSAVLGDDQDLDWHVGLGAKVYLSDRLHLRADARLYRSNAKHVGQDDGGDTNHYGLTLGLGWTLTRAPRAPAPPADGDGDGIADATDECPTDAGVAPSGCPERDTDGDGLIGADDRCPDQAETVNGFEDTDGCPDEMPDLDNDGLRGAADQCPEQPEDLDSFGDEDGCPDPDNDGDQLLDGADACPGEAGPAENRGCPDTDRDQDTVIDRLDNCPDEAGTPDNQGCKAKQLVVITQAQLKILDKVYFRSAKAVIEKRSNKLLDNVAAVLGSHPEIKLIRIEGHTDDVGDDAKNKTLSQQRADAVVAYLVKKGVAAERLTAVGFGEEKPIADNATKAGQAENRRVEFNIVSDAAPAPAPAGDGTMKPEF